MLDPQNWWRDNLSIPVQSQGTLSFATPITSADNMTLPELLIYCCLKFCWLDMSKYPLFPDRVSMTNQSNDSTSPALGTKELIGPIYWSKCVGFLKRSWVTYQQLHHWKTSLHSDDNFLIATKMESPPSLNLPHTIFSHFWRQWYHM